MTAGEQSRYEPPEITVAGIRELLADPKLLPRMSVDLDEDAEFTLDSLGVMWLLHLVEQHYALPLTPSDEMFTEFSSVRGITDYLRRAAAVVGNNVP